MRGRARGRAAPRTGGAPMGNPARHGRPGGACRGKFAEFWRTGWGCGTFGEHKVNGRCLMKVSKVSEQLVLHWVTVVDASGETRLQAVWTTSSAAVPTGHAA